MADSVSLTLTKDAIRDKLEGMLTRSESMKGGFSRIYSIYQKLQTKRFQTENASEGGRWDSLTPAYAASKLKTFSSYPGGGRKLLIATGTLAGSVIGPGSPFGGVDKHRAQFTSSSMIIRVEESGTNLKGKPFTYPRYVNEKRDFMTFSDKSLTEMREELSKFVLGF